MHEDYQIARPSIESVNDHLVDAKLDKLEIRQDMVIDSQK